MLNYLKVSIALALYCLNSRISKCYFLTSSSFSVIRLCVLSNFSWRSFNLASVSAFALNKALTFYSKKSLSCISFSALSFCLRYACYASSLLFSNFTFCDSRSRISIASLCILSLISFSFVVYPVCKIKISAFLERVSSSCSICCLVSNIR